MPNGHKPDPCSIVIFGATGDLTHRLVVPALYNLAAGNLLPDNFCVVGIARKGWLRPGDVLNTLPVEALLTFLKQRRQQGSLSSEVKNQ